MTAQLLSKTTSDAPYNAPEDLKTLWQHVPETAIGYFATLWTADFCLKSDLEKKAIHEKKQPDFEWGNLMEGRFFWQDRGNPIELRWRQYRNFEGTLCWQILTAGDFPPANNLGFESAQGVEPPKTDSGSSDTETKVFLRKPKDIPRTFHYPGANLDNQQQLVQRIWKKGGMPFYYQWVGIEEYH